MKSSQRAGMTALLAIGLALTTVPVQASEAPFTVSPTVITLNDGRVFEDNGHLNIRTNLRSWNVHLEGKCVTRTDAECSGERHTNAQLIGKSAYSLDLAVGECVQWVQKSGENYHFGENGETPVCNTPTPEPTEEPTWNPTTEPPADPEPSTAPPVEEPESPQPSTPSSPEPEPTESESTSPTPTPTDPPSTETPTDLPTTDLEPTASPSLPTTTSPTSPVPSPGNSEKPSPQPPLPVTPPLSSSTPTATTTQSPSDAPTQTSVTTATTVTGTELAATGVRGLYATLGLLVAGTLLYGYGIRRRREDTR